ncbi:hypothetical protein C1645_882231 [Glomus cerebriforme]|uniref:Uncharacterized protein n=1 Tax=Glomus cerebriforme TaxID=658196 RepID=A0A397S6H5_9GLOM|nr:hypothetical protein C1645_882231 [Glomus cerebriforme]
MAGFIKTVPVVPTVMFENVKHFLRNRALFEDEIVMLLKWWISYKLNGNIANISEFKQFARINNGNSSRSLNIIRYFLNPGLIPPHMATEEEQKADYSNEIMQNNLSIPNKIVDIIFEQSKSQTEQNNSIDDNDEIKDKSKRIYSGEEKEDLTDNKKSKKIKLNNNEVEISYIQRNYIAKDDDEITNNPNFHPEDQDELEISDGKLDEAQMSQRLFGTNGVSFNVAGVSICGRSGVGALLALSHLHFLKIVVVQFPDNVDNVL